MTGYLAALPMYDWPEVEQATDRLWAYLRTALLDHGFQPPQQLSRDLDCWDVWRSPRLLLSQTCGLPYDLHLRETVEIVGTPIYQCAGDPEGSYHSVLIARQGEGSRATHLKQNGTIAVNATDSQSGFAALLNSLTVDTSQNLRDRLTISGSHRESIQQVADGRADLAAIDCVSWHLAQQFEPATAKLSVIGRTPKRPGLPLITSRKNVAQGIADAVESCFDALPGDIVSVLSISGLKRTVAADYNDFAREFRTNLAAHQLVV